MFHVKNNKIINRISKRSLKNSKTRNIIAMISIILTAVLFTTVFTIGTSIIESFQLSTMRQVGTRAHGGFKFLTQQQYDKITADPKVKDISYNIHIGSPENKELNKTYTELRYTEEKAAKWSFSMPTTGTLPKERVDIATTTNVLDALGLPHKLGVTVPLEFTANGIKYKENFTLCGFYEMDPVMGANQAYLSREYCNEVAPVWQKGQEDSFDWDNYSGSINPQLFFSSSWNIDQKMQDLKTRCGFDHTVCDGINWAYSSAEVDATTICLIAGLLILIMLSGYLIIYNIFYISVSNEIKFYGLLKTIGTTNQQLKRIVRKQALFLGVMSIPVGLIIGYLLSILIIPIVVSTTSMGSNYTVSVNPLIFIGSSLFSLVTVWISCIRPCRLVSKISPVEAVRYTDNASGKQKKYKKTKKSTPFTMARENTSRTPKKTVSVVLSLSLSLILLNGTITLVNGFDMDKYIENSVVSDFYITDASITNLNSTSKVFNGVAPKIRKQLMELGSISEIGSLYMREYEHTLDYTGLEKSKKIFKEYGHLIPFPEVYEQAKTNLNHGKIYSHLYGVDDFVAKKMKIVEGQLDMDKLKTGNYIIASTMTDIGKGHFYDIGDKVIIDYGNGRKKKYEVMALGDIAYALGPQHSHLFDVYFTMDSEEFMAQTGETSALSTAFNINPDDYDKTEKWVTNYCGTINSSLDYRSKKTFTDEFKTMQNMYLLVGSALSFVLALIGILNFINAIITSIQTRRQELAVLQSIGMTGSQLKKMLINEGLWYILFTVIFTLSIGSLITYGIVQAIANQIWFFTYHFIIIPILLGIPALLFIAVIIPVICYKHMCQKSIVDRLHETEG